MPATTTRWSRSAALGNFNEISVLPLASARGTQPRGPKYEKDFWQADVTKMIKLYGAPIEEMDIPKIAEYLAATY